MSKRVEMFSYILLQSTLGASEQDWGVKILWNQQWHIF